VPFKVARHTRIEQHMSPGKPTDYTAELAARICAELATGRSLRDVCRDDDMPHESTVRAWALVPSHGRNLDAQRWLIVLEGEHHADQQ
jgi:hypothetical protein